jgi:hypothetical protein
MAQAEEKPAIEQIHLAWLGLGLPPFAWIAQIAANYALVPWLCRWERGPLLLQLIVGAAVLIAGAGVAIAWYEWRRHGGGSVLSAGSSRNDRPRFMALWGLLLGGLLLALIGSQAVPVFLVPPCE